MSKSVSSIAALFAALFVFSSSAAYASTSGVVISQIYGGGGNSSATYKNDFIELFNAGSSAVDISGWSVQYTSSSGSSWGSNIGVIPASTSLQPGQYYLIEENAGTSGTGADLPTADFVDGAQINLSGSKGKVALVNDSTPLTATDCPTDASIVDFVGFGSANCSEGNNPVGSLSNTTAAIRADGGCTDGNINATDFAVDTPTPRNSSSSTHVCSGSSGITVSIADVGHSEGNSGTTAYDFVVTLSASAPVGGVTFDIATSDGTATIADNDYSANSASNVTIAENGTTATFTVLVNGDATIESNETFTVTATNIVGTNVGTTAANATGTIYNDDPTDAEIYTIQGNPTTQGADGASPFKDLLVHTSGIVTVIGPDGFYVQTADADADTDPLTSNGIYVYDKSDHPIPGDSIDFVATVSEYYGLTELTFVDNLTILSSGNALPTAVEFGDNIPSPDPSALSCGDTNFECYEGMLVHISNGFVTQGSGKAGSHTYDYLYVTATGKRSLRDPGLLFGLTQTAGDNAAAPIWDGNPEVFEMSPNEFPGVNNANVPVNGGSTFTATGVIGYNFGAYEFYPATLDIIHAPMPRAVPMADPTILRIGEFNVERFCDDVDDTIPAPAGTAPIPPGKELYACTGGSLPSATEYDTKAQRIADYIGTVLNLPDVVAVEEVENIGALTKLAGKLNNDYGTSYTPKLEEGHDVSGIDVGYLINTARVQVSSIQQLDSDLMWHTPNGHDRNVFDHPPLLLQGVFTGASQNQAFMVMVNHLKARQDVDDVNSSGQSTSSALEDQEKRFRQAYAIALQVQNLQSNTTIPLAVVGDFNAYQFTDGFADLIGMISGRYNFDANMWDLSDLTMWNLEPITAPLADTNVVTPALWNAVNSLPENEQYSYLYAPNFGVIQGYGFGGEGSRKVPTDQVLDHALLNTAARANFVRMDYGRANEDAASEDEKNSTGAIGVSDHDGFVIQLTFDRIFANGFDNSN